MVEVTGPKFVFTIRTSPKGVMMTTEVPEVMMNLTQTSDEQIEGVD